MRVNRIASACVVCLFATASPFAARANDKNDEYRVTISPSFPFFGQKDWIATGYLGYVEDGEKSFHMAQLEAGAIWKVSQRNEWWFLLEKNWTDNESSPDVNETRPVIGFKNYLPGSDRAKFYNLARAEYRYLDRDGAADSQYLRLRDRIGAVFAVGGAGAQSPWYGIADAELTYRFDKNISDQARLRVGVGWISNDRVRVEFIYHMQFTRDTADESFQWTDNIWRLNFKVAFKEGLLRRLIASDVDE
jgi:Protein of unknown function (DUF2490)